MNSLSWMIYAADVVGGADFIANAICLIAALAALGLVFFGSLLRVGAIGDDIKNSNRLYRVAAFRALPAFVVAGLLAAFIPSSGTIYAIAASEMGETALNSETGGKAIEALNAWLDRQIGEQE